MNLNSLMSHERCIVLDTETTGMPVEQGHKLTEIGAVEVIDRKPTGRTFQVYIDPVREVDEEAEEVHGNSRTDLIRLSGGKKFADVAEDFKQFVNGAPLVIHNAKFDMGFLDVEYERIGQETLTKSVNGQVFDTLSYANAKFPGRRNNLDSLCKRFGVNNSHRDIHGALVDAVLLSDVFLLMTQEQQSIIRVNDAQKSEGSKLSMKLKTTPIHPDLSSKLKVVTSNKLEQEKHNNLAKRIGKESRDNSLVPSF